MLLIAKKLEELDFDQLMELYREGNEENGRYFWPEESPEKQRIMAKTEFRRYLEEDFYCKKGAVYALLEKEGRYLSGLRLEPYRNGFLMEALETHPRERRKGYASCLICRVQEWLGDAKIYSHVSRRNTASLRTHLRCGFTEFHPYEEEHDGTRNDKAVTLCWEGDSVMLEEYHGEQEAACELIQGFWKAHNDWLPTQEEAMEDLSAWTEPGHKFYFVVQMGLRIGFVHLGSRGAAMDWLEDLFLVPEKQGQGIGSRVIVLVENIVKEYSESLYMEAAVRNTRAIRLYHRAGYNILNTVTLRKDFHPETHETVRTETLMDLDFQVRFRKV